MLFGASQSFQRARDARRRARIEERKRRRVMRATCTLATFATALIAMCSVFELRRMKVRYEAAAAVAAASRATHMLEEDLSLPVTVPEAASEQVPHEKLNEQYSVWHEQGQSRIYADDSDSRNFERSSSKSERDLDVDQGKINRSERQNGSEAILSEGVVLSESSGTNNGSKNGGNGLKDDVIMPAVVLDSLDDEEGGNRPIITLSSKLAGESTSSSNLTNEIPNTHHVKVQKDETRSPAQAQP